MFKKNLYIQLTTSRLPRIIAPLIVFALIVGFGYMQLSNARTVYKTSARIWVQKSLFGGGGRGAQPGEIPESPLMEGATNLTTFCEVVQSDAVLKLAYEDLQKQLPADRLPERGALAGIRAQPAKDANIITIEYTSPSEELSSLVVKSVINALMKENSMQIKGPLEESRERLEMQLDIARKDYAASKERLKDFQNSVGSIDFTAEANGLAQVRGDLQQQIDEASNELKALKTKNEFLEKQLGFGPQDVLAVEKISNDEVVNNLKQTIAQTEVKLIELRSKFQDEHPRVKRLKAVLDDAKVEMAARYSALIGKVDPKFEGISRDSEVQHELLNEMVQASTDMVAGESKLQSLSESLDSLNSRISILPTKQRELADLQRQDELATNTLAAVESELQRVKLTESVSLSSSRLQVIDSSKFAQSSCGLSMPIIALIGVVAAGFVAAGQYLLDPRLLSVAVLRSLSLKFVGWFPALNNDPAQIHQYADRLRLSVRHWLSGNKVIWLTSPGRADGKSLVAKALAESFAEAGYRAVLIDANLIQPDLHMEYGVPASPGILNYLSEPDEMSVGPILQEVRQNLFFVPAGGVSENLRLLSGLRFEKFVESMNELFDVIVIDGSSADEVEGSIQICESRPNLLLVVRMKHTMKSNLQMLKNQVQMLPVSEVGVVVNETTPAAVSKMVTVESGPAGPPGTQEREPSSQAVTQQPVSEGVSSTPAAW